MLRCEECGTTSEDAHGWVAHLVDDQGILAAEHHAAPYVVLYCPACAEREFGPRG